MSNHPGFKYNTCNNADEQAIPFSNFLLLFPGCFLYILSSIEKLSATSSSRGSQSLLPVPATFDKIPPTIVSLLWKNLLSPEDTPRRESKMLLYPHQSPCSLHSLLHPIVTPNMHTQTHVYTHMNTSLFKCPRVCMRLDTRASVLTRFREAGQGCVCSPESSTRRVPVSTW